MKIEKGSMTREVTFGAFKTLFKPKGWKEATEEETFEEDLTEEGNYEPNEDDFLEKPASEMTNKELKSFAKKVGLKGKFSSKEELLQAVINYQKENN